MGDILVLYHGVYGQTKKVCECLRAELERLGRRADVVRFADSGGVDPSGYGIVVLGAAIRNGKHNPLVIDWIRRNQPLLDAKPNAFFSVNLVARKAEKATPETNPYLQKFLQRSPWRPKLLGVFAGDLDYQRYGVLDRWAIRMIMKITGGPTDPTTKIEYTDWDEVRKFAGRVAALAPAPGP